jgi:preprotein translocase subunit SecG
MLYQIILFFHSIAAICIVILVLIQQGKGATMGAGFGASASQTVFGSRGSSSFLFKVTVVFMLFFFGTSLSLNYMTTSSYKKERNLVLPVNFKNKQANVNNHKESGDTDRIVPTLPPSASPEK